MPPRMRSIRRRSAHDRMGRRASTEWSRSVLASAARGWRQGRIDDLDVDLFRSGDAAAQIARWRHPGSAHEDVGCRGRDRARGRCAVASAGAEHAGPGRCGRCSRVRCSRGRRVALVPAAVVAAHATAGHARCAGRRRHAQFGDALDEEQRGQADAQDAGRDHARIVARASPGRAAPPAGAAGISALVDASAGEREPWPASRAGR